MATVFVLVETTPGTLSAVRDRIEIEGPKRVLAVTGAYDLLVEVEAPTIADALKYVRERILPIEGLRKTETMVAVDL